MYFRYVYMVGQIFLGGIFLLAVIAGIRSWVWKVIWLVAAGSLWYFAGLFFAALLQPAPAALPMAETCPCPQGAAAFLKDANVDIGLRGGILQRPRFPASQGKCLWRPLRPRISPPHTPDWRACRW